MPSVLSESDKETVKRTVPKAANKIHAVAVARLYVAHPDRQRWVYTGLQGAAVLANDLVGNTYWIKLVDISGSNRGVIWDQEIYDPFYYNQDRTFFHSFELEDCLAGFSFVNEKEAKQFKKKIDDREKNASKDTKATPFQGAGGQPATNGGLSNGKSHHGLFGGIGSLLHGQRSSSAPSIPPSQPQQQLPSAAPPREHSNLDQVQYSAPTSDNRDRASSLDTVDPSWRGILGELLEMGITEDQIEENSEFIKEYIEQRKASGAPMSEASNGTVSRERDRAPPPPPPPGAPATRLHPISPQSTGTTMNSRRGPAPAPPPSRRSRESQSTIAINHTRSPSRSPERTPSPPRPSYQFKAPPPLADAGKFAHVSAPSLPKRPRATSNVPSSGPNSGPPPPPRPPKTPMEDDSEARPKFGVPPPFQGERTPSAAPPPPPSRAPLQASSPRLPQTGPAPPPLPPKTPSAPPPSSAAPPPPPLPNHHHAAAPPPPPLPSAPRPAPAGGPPPPPLPSSGAPPPPPPMPASAGPAPPPLPPGREAANAPPLPKSTGGKEDVLASIRATGGIGALKKVSDKEKRDRSAAAVPGAEPNGGSSAAAAAPSGGGGLGDALAAALSQRNKKVSAGDDDDEDDDDDDWDAPPKKGRLWKQKSNKPRSESQNPTDLPPLPSFLDDVGGASIGRSKTGKSGSELKLRCTELDENGNVTTVNGEFKKSELIAKYGLLPRDLRKIDSSLLPHILVRPSAILINLLHLRVLIKHNCVLVLDAYGSTDSFAQSQFMYDLSGKLSQRDSRQSGGLPYEFRALEAVLISVTTGLESEFEGVSGPVVRVLRELEEDIDRDKLRHLLIYSKKLGTFEQKARLVRDAIDDLLEADDDLVAMYLTERAEGKTREEEDHTEVEMLLESYHKVCDEIVQVSGNLVTNIRNTEEIVKAILDANRNSLMLLDLKFSIGTLGIGTGAFVASLYGMNLKNFIEESDLGFIGVTGWSFVFAAIVCIFGLRKLRRVQRVSMFGERGNELGSWREVSAPPDTSRNERLKRLGYIRHDGLKDGQGNGMERLETLPPVFKEKQ